VSPEIGLSEVVELLGCSKSAALKYTHRGDFPEPRELARGRVWDRDEVKAWGKAHLKKDRREGREGKRTLPTGRPPKTAD
jgi:predicted DNA-binding transcriptional regulator AlpA